MIGGAAVTSDINLNTHLNYLLQPLVRPTASLSPPTPPKPLPSKSPAQRTSSPTDKIWSASQPIPVVNELPSDLGKYIDRDVSLVKRLGWHRFVKLRRSRGDFAELKFDHPARRLLVQYKYRGVPVKFHSAPWSDKQKHHALQRGPHQSCRNHLEFLSEEFCDMIRKEQWVVLPYQVANQLPNLRLSPPGVVPQRDRRPRWIVDYSFSGVNQDTLPLAPSEAM